MPSCHYRILSHARYTHAMGKLDACDDTVTTHVWPACERYLPARDERCMPANVYLVDIYLYT